MRFLLFGIIGLAVFYLGALLFLKANPALEPDMITITCKQGYIEEVRLCLSRDLDPVPCGRDVIRDCTSNDALFDPIR